MASILEFKRSTYRASAQAMRDGATAEIVFFPGVRYERMSDTPEPAPKQKRRRSRRTRDRIDLDV